MTAPWPGGRTLAEADTASGDLRRCEACDALFARRKSISRPQFAKYRFCSRSCAHRAIATTRGRAGGLAKAAKARAGGIAKTGRVRAAPRPTPVKPIVEEPGDWRIYRLLGPKGAAGSLSEAQARAAIGDPRYVEIENRDTGRRLMRFEGKWTETQPAGRRSIWATP